MSISVFYHILLLYLVFTIFKIIGLLFRIFCLLISFNEILKNVTLLGILSTFGRHFMRKAVSEMTLETLLQTHQLFFD